MEETKYELTQETKYADGTILYRIRALKDFADVKSGDLGGWIEKEENLSQEGDAWVSDDACVRDNACVRDKAWVSGNAQVSGNAWVCDDAWVRDHARVSGNALIIDNANVTDNACVSDNVCVRDKAWVSGNARLKDNAKVYGYALVYDNARVNGFTKIDGNARISGHACVNSNEDYATVTSFGSVYRTTTFFRQKDGSIGVQCGCFCGTLEEFRAKVRKTYPSDKKGKEYLMLADLMEYRFASK